MAFGLRSFDLRQDRMTAHGASTRGQEVSKRIIWIAFLVLLASSQSGCLWLALGGGAAGGYAVAEDERSVGVIVVDASITAAVKFKLAKDDTVDAIDINVDTHRSVVTLHGNVPSQGVADRAVNLARSVKGVRNANSRLVIVGY
jgi:hyperosmotically inducible protein